MVWTSSGDLNQVPHKSSDNLSELRGSREVEPIPSYYKFSPKSFEQRGAVLKIIEFTPRCQFSLISGTGGNWPLFQIIFFPIFWLPWGTQGVRILCWDIILERAQKEFQRSFKSQEVHQRSSELKWIKESLKGMSEIWVAIFTLFNLKWKLSSFPELKVWVLDWDSFQELGNIKDLLTNKERLLHYFFWLKEL